MLHHETKSLGAALLLISLLSACGSVQYRDKGPSVANLQPQPLPASGRELPKVDIERVREQYQRVLAVTVDPQTRINVQRRLAGLEMLRSEQRQIDTPQVQRYYDKAIAQYQTLIDAHPERADNDRLHYQVAKAYELDGRVEESAGELGRLTREYPRSEHYAEAQFRHGEMLFSRRDYALAEQAYRAVVDAGDLSNTASESAYYGNAIYMRGWALFKQGRYQASLASFTRVLDRILGDRGGVEGLSRGDLEMVQDTLRVTSLVFSYLDGADSIRRYLAESGTRPYQHLLYDSLGSLYLEKQRYRDGAETYASYVEQYPTSEHAPDFSVRLIDVYQQGDFPSEILPAKEAFARRYGVQSSYWSSGDQAVHQRLRPHLYQYLEELARYYHGTAQIMQAELGANNKSPGSSATQQQQIHTSLLTAGNWYAEFAETFPNDHKTPGMVFLMAEALNDAGELPRAIAAYERVAYADYPHRDPTQGAEAAYSAILVYDRLLVGLEAEPAAGWRRQKIDSELRFAEVYPGDDRALPVLTRAAEELLQTGSARDAVVAARRVTSWQPQATAGLRRTAWLVQGHGSFQLADYIGAEQAYGGALGLIEGQDDSRGAVLERLAASVYKQAETHRAAGEQAAAIDDFLRVATVAPGSAIAITASYDGANGLIELQHWDRAEQELIRFRGAYPKHPLAETVPAKLVHIYQQRGDWRRAADELTLIAARDESAQVRRKSLYMAAELYDKGGVQLLAIERYTEYANSWPQPFGLATEARYQLSLLYQQLGDGGQRRRWLRQLISSHDSAGAQASERSRYLAAMASAVFAEDAYQQFRDAPLTAPLKNSFKAKKKRMQASLAACEKVLAYGVAEFVTEANFRIGEIYGSLSEDLMGSERPRGLSALELEQYDMLLEEQAYPFEEKAISIHEANARRSWLGVYDPWVRRSMETLSTLLPARYAKPEILVRYSNDIY